MSLEIKLRYINTWKVRKKTSKAEYTKPVKYFTAFYKSLHANRNFQL